MQPFQTALSTNGVKPYIVAKSLDVVNYLDGFADDIDSYVDYHSDMIPDQ